MQRGRPVNASLAIAASLLPLPAMWLLDRSSGGCGDGLCGFIPGLAILSGLVVATLVFIRRSIRRDETPGALRILPLLLWGAALVPMLA